MAMGFDNARHFLQRTGFGANPTEIEAWSALEPSEAVSRLLSEMRTEPSTSPPDWVGEAPPSRAEAREMGDTFREQRRQRGQELKRWWMREMLQTPSPFTERMTLFWHNHFTSSLQEVRSPQLMYRQNALFRRHAAGNFGQLLHAVSADPAMMIYLDTRTNERAHPNENFARELLELFTLGEGHYTESDIREAARAFTGWRVDRQTGALRIARRLHDPGLKTFLGRTGRFDGHDIIDILLDHPRTAQTIVEKLWRVLISDTPDPGAVTALADRFHRGDYALAPLLSDLLSSADFYAAAHRAVLVKSPVDLLVGTARMLGVPLGNSTRLTRMTRRLGQDLFDPPNVRGWPTGTGWITTTSLLQRNALLDRLMHRPEITFRASRRGLLQWAGHQLADASQARRLAAAVLLPTQPSQPLPADASVLASLERLLLDPVYQLK